jgi:hypothetical protein
MWLKWVDRRSGTTNHRGYGPAVQKPPTTHAERRELLKLFVDDAVPGEIRDEGWWAAEFEERFAGGHNYRSGCWVIDLDRARYLAQLCRPRQTGLYSWSRVRPDCHNCSSWVIAIVNEVMDEPDFLCVEHPKLLSSVRDCLWRDGPNHQRWDRGEVNR